MTATLPKLLADFDTQLASGVAISDTTATLVSATDDDGVALPTGTYGLTIDAGNTSKEYIICTLTSTALTGILSITRQGVTSSGFAHSHRRGAKVTVTDWAILSRILKLLNGTGAFDSTAPLNYDAHPTFTTDYQIVDKKYVDDVAIAGSPDASTTTKGISKLSSAPVSPTDPIAVGDNDTRVPTQGENDALVGTSGTPSSSNKYVTNDDTATAATASKVARRLAGGNITVVTETQGNNSTNAASTAYVDTAITALPAQSVPEQNIPYYVGTGSTEQGSMWMQTNLTGTIGFLAYQGSSTATLIIKRIVRDTKTNQFYMTHTVTLSAPSVNISNPTIVVLGSYLYVAFLDSGTPTVRRYDAADLTNLTSITISGGTGNVYVSGFTDGTYLYFYKTTDTYKKYSVSGTTITYVADITYTSSGIPRGACCDGTNVYLASMSGNVLPIVKYPLSGGSVTSTTSIYIYFDAYQNGSGNANIYLVDTNKLGISYGYANSGPSVNVGSVAKLTAITLP